jgi:hypothetical protein
MFDGSAMLESLVSDRTGRAKCYSCANRRSNGYDLGGPPVMVTMMVMMMPRHVMMY